LNNFFHVAIQYCYLTISATRRCLFIHVIVLDRS